MKSGLEFSIEFLTGDADWPVGILARSAAGTARGLLRIDRAQCASLLAWRAADRGGAAPRLTAEDLGKTLFRALFHGPVAALWHSTLGQLDECRSSPLRLQFADPGEEDALRPFAALAWEALCDPSTPGPVESRRVVIVRTVAGGHPSPRPAAFPPLRIVGAWAQTGDDLPGLESERQALVRAVRPLQPGRWLQSLGVRGAELRWCHNATPADLQEALYGHRAEILHFMGHGGWRGGRGGLAFVGPNGHGVSWVPGPLLADNLVHAGLQLVVLTACRSGSVPEDGPPGPFASVAATLVRHGVPAVVAMQAPLDDALAPVFTQRLYQCLLAGDSIEVAVHEARLALHNQATARPDWAVPVLYLRAEHGHLSFERRRGPTRTQWIAAAHYLPLGLWLALMGGLLLGPLDVRTSLDWLGAALGTLLALAAGTAIGWAWPFLARSRQRPPRWLALGSLAAGMLLAAAGVSLLVSRHGVRPRPIADATTERSLSERLPRSLAGVARERRPLTAEAHQTLRCRRADRMVEATLSTQLSVVPAPDATLESPARYSVRLRACWRALRAETTLDEASLSVALPRGVELTDLYPSSARGHELPGEGLRLGPEGQYLSVEPAADAAQTLVRVKRVPRPFWRVRFASGATEGCLTVDVALIAAADVRQLNLDVRLSADVATPVLGMSTMTCEATARSLAQTLEISGR